MSLLYRTCQVLCSNFSCKSETKRKFIKTGVYISHRTFAPKWTWSIHTMYTCCVKQSLFDNVSQNSKNTFDIFSTFYKWIWKSRFISLLTLKAALMWTIKPRCHRFCQRHWMTSANGAHLRQICFCALPLIQSLCLAKSLARPVNRFKPICWIRFRLKRSTGYGRRKIENTVPNWKTVYKLPLCTISQMCYISL